jgi:hypothetical protein
MTAAQINAALESVESTYQGLPHTGVDADLQALAADMTASGTFSSATVTPGGIDATFPNGRHALVFADRLADLAGPLYAAVSGPRLAGPQPRGRTAWMPGPFATNQPVLSGANAHEVAFLVNESDNHAFTPQRQIDFGKAFSNDGFTPANGYGVDVLDVNLENIATLGTGHTLDFLDIATHGMVDDGLGYDMVSTTPISDATLQTYAADIAAGNIKPDVELYSGGAPWLYTLAFDGTYLTEHLHFNPGAIVDNQSCYGQSPVLLRGLGLDQILHASGVGRYIGWSDEVQGADADQSDAFLFDRLLGESSPSITGLNQYAAQHTPPQRPFPLDQIQDAMNDEVRASGPIEPWPYSVNATYSESVDATPNPRESGLIADLVVTDYGAEGQPNAPIEYALPSISRLVADEQNAQLDIFGAFPSTPGTVAIASTAGTATPAPVSWTTTEVIVPLSATGAGANGLVTVTDAGIASNAVPLTEWTGQITYSANGSLSNWDGDSGSGFFTLQGVFNATLRADVHPTVVTIDASPVPQTFAFTGLVPGSSGALTAGSGTFTSDNSQGNSCKNCTITLDLADPQPTMVPQPLSSGSANAFYILPETGPTPPAGVSVPSPPANCNAGLPGPAPSNTNPQKFCGFLYYNVNNPVTCSGNTNYCSLVNGPLMDELPLNLGVDYFAPGFTLAMDPIYYRLTFTSPQQTLDLSPFDEPSTGTASLTGTFLAPQSAPGNTTPASRVRRF